MQHKNGNVLFESEFFRCEHFCRPLADQPPSPRNASKSVLSTDPMQVKKTLTSPALKIDTPHILPSNPTPLYVDPWRAMWIQQRCFPPRDKNSVEAHRRGLDCFGYNREVVQAFLDKQADNPVRIKEEVSTVGIFISDNRVQCLQLRRLRKSKDRGGQQRWVMLRVGGCRHFFRSKL